MIDLESILADIDDIREKITNLISYVVEQHDTLFDKQIKKLSKEEILQSFKEIHNKLKSIRNELEDIEDEIEIG